MEQVKEVKMQSGDVVIPFREEWLYERSYHYIQGYAVSRGFLNTLRALPLAKDLHQGQYRKGTSLIDGMEVRLPYVVHVLKVCTTLMNLNLPLFDEELDVLYASAILHDVLEDCQAKLPNHGKELVTTYGLSQEVLDVVKTLSKRSGASREELEEYFDDIRKNKMALLIKLSDRGHNVETLSSMKPEKIHEYVQETRDFIYPMCAYAKVAYPEITCGITLLKSKIVSLTEATETLLNMFQK